MGIIFVLYISVYRWCISILFVYLGRFILIYCCFFFLFEYLCIVYFYILLFVGVFYLYICIYIYIFIYCCFCFFICCISFLILVMVVLCLGIRSDIFFLNFDIFLNVSFILFKVCLCLLMFFWN